MQKAVSFPWEILFVDKASTNDMREVVQKKIPQMPVSLLYVYESKSGLNHGPHRGARESAESLLPIWMRIWSCSRDGFRA